MLILLSFVPFTMCQCCSVLNAFLRYGFLPLIQVKLVRVTKRVHEAYFAQLYLTKVYISIYT